MKKSNGGLDNLNKLRKQYTELSEENQWFEKQVNEIPQEHIIGYVDVLWRDYLNLRKKSQKLFFNQFDWQKGEPFKSYSTSKRRKVNAQLDRHGYINWVWA